MSTTDNNNPQPQITPKKFERYDQTYGKLENRFGLANTEADEAFAELADAKEKAGKEGEQPIPYLAITDGEWEQLKEYGLLRRQEREHDEAVNARRKLLNDGSEDALTPDQRDVLTQLNRQIADLELTKEQDERKNRIGRKLVVRVERFIRLSRAELLRAPKEQAFDGFQKVDEQNRYDEILEQAIKGEETPEKKPGFSVLALEEVRILLHRLFGKHARLRAFFDEYVVLKYNTQRSQQRAEVAGSATAAELGGATITSEHENGHNKMMVTVDDATFIQFRLDSQGKQYPVVNLVESAFTIGRAILRAAFNDNKLHDILGGHQEPGAKPGPFGADPARFPEGLLKDGSAATVTTNSAHFGHTEEALDFLAFYLLDPQQATKLSPTWATRSQRLLKELKPGERLQLPAGEAITQGQGRLNYDYLYYDYDYNRKDPSWIGRLGAKLANDPGSVVARLGTGGILGGLLGSAALSTPGGALGLLGGSIIGLTRAAQAPLKFMRSFQQVFNERHDFYYELAVSEHDKKEVSRILGREENIGDRDARLGMLIRTNNMEESRRMLLADSQTADFNIWRVFLWLYHFDHKFKHSGGQEIGQESFNLVTRLHRESNRAKRHGSKARFFGREEDEYGRVKYKLIPWDDYKAGVWSELMERSEREAQGTAQETFQMMEDTKGWNPLQGEAGAMLGENLDDPDSRGWYLPQVGDARQYFGEGIREFMEWMQGKGEHGGFKGDARYNLKFNANEICTLERMRTFGSDKFPGEHTKQKARDAFNHFNDKLEYQAEELAEEDEKRLQQIEQESVDHLLSDVDTRPKDVVELLEETVKETYDRPFGNNPGGKMLPNNSIRKQFDKRLNTLGLELERMKAADEIPETLRGELSKLTRYYRDDLANLVPAAGRATHEAHLASSTKRIETMLEGLGEEQQFAARTWLTKLTEYAPRVSTITHFREELLSKIRVYQANASHDPLAESASTITKEFDAIMADYKRTHNESDTAQRVKNLADRANDLLLRPVFSADMVAMAGAIDAVSGENFGKRLEQIHGSFKKAADGRKGEFEKDLPKDLDKQRDEVERLARDVAQSIRIHQNTPALAASFEAEPGQKHEDLVERFRLLNLAIPEDIRTEISAAIPADANERVEQLKTMLYHLKLAYTALWNKSETIKDKAKKASGGTDAKKK